MTKGDDFRLERFAIGGADGLLAKARRWHARAWARPAHSVREPRWFAAVVLKLDRIGDFVLALGAIRLVCERFGEENGLARTTVLTMMDRLLKKGYLSRQQVEGDVEAGAQVGALLVLGEVVPPLHRGALVGALGRVVAELDAARLLDVYRHAHPRA